MTHQLFSDNSPLDFEPTSTKFGWHEKFPLRYGWLSKGFHAFSDIPRIFQSDSATVQLGVGSNMVKSIRNWLLATQMIREKGKSVDKSTIGDFLLDKELGVDPYLEDEGTIWFCIGC